MIDRRLLELSSQLLEPGHDPERVTDQVLARVRALPTPRTTWWRRFMGAVTQRWRSLTRWTTGALLVLIAGSLTITPVRAQIAEWFSFLGVAVRPAATSPTTVPVVPSATPGLSLDEAARLAGFRPIVPEPLGPPEAVEISADRRIVSLSWITASGVVRLDEFAERLDPTFTKLAVDAEWVDLGGDRYALWFPTPHEVVVVDGSGDTRTAPPRLAAQTLIWERDGLTLRLEGNLTRDRAVEIAQG